MLLTLTGELLVSVASAILKEYLRVAMTARIPYTDNTNAVYVTVSLTQQAWMPMAAPLDTSVIENVRRLLEGLKKTSDGAIMYLLIERALRKFSGASGQVELAFVVFLHKLLSSYANTPNNDPATRMKARVLQQRLVPFLPEDVVTAPRPAATTAAAAQKSTPATPPKSAAQKPPGPARHAPIARPAPPPQTAAKKPDVKPSRPQAQTRIEDVTPIPPRSESGVPNNNEDDVDMLQIKVAHNVAEIISRNRAFDALLHNSLDVLLQSHDDAEIEDLKQVLVNGIEELINGQQSLGEKLSTTSTYLNAIHNDRRKLRDTLDKVRKHSLSDELTGLPNHSAFVRQMDGEIGRAKRYGFSLVVAIVDVDGLASINAVHGRPAGDAVLQCYAREIMSQFRGYDMVARYGGDEFAILFPNTQKEGATRALEKAQKRVAETYITHAGVSIPLPSFSSVLTLYAPGEKPATLLQRAGTALDHAKLRGPHQMVVALPGN